MQQKKAALAAPRVAAQSRRVAMRPSAAERTPAVASKSRSAPSGCGCGGASRKMVSVSRCPDCGHTRSEALSVRNDEGKCEPNPFEISCDTQVRLKQCVKTVICDTLWCLESALCPDGQPDLGGLNEEALKECLGTALCSLIRCVPEVLCPPPTECPRLPAADWDCSYAVEDLP